MYWLVDIVKATLINKILMASIPLLGLRYVISTIANIGYVMIGLASVNDEAIKASFLYMFIYTLATLGVFSFIMILRREDRQLVTVSDISGLSRSKPLLALSVAILLLSLAGIPPFGGFFGKLFINSLEIG